jgi:hypothetical protein
LCRKKPDLWSAVDLWFKRIYKVKNRLIGDFFDVLCTKRNNILALRANAIVEPEPALQALFGVIH